MDKQEAIRSILDSLRRLVRELRVSSRRAEVRFGLTAAQLFVLERVAAHQPVSVNELAGLTLTHQSSVSVVVQRLVERGFLDERPAPQDRRRKELTISAPGRKALGRMPAPVQGRLIAGLAAIGNQERTALARLLKRFTEQIGLQDAEPVLFFENERRERPRRARRAGPGSTRREKRA